MPGLNHFNLLAPLYDRLFPLRASEGLLELARLPVEGPVLDAGGGTGRVAQALVGQAGLVVVADLSMEMLLQAAKKGGLRQVCTQPVSFSRPAG